MGTSLISTQLVTAEVFKEFSHVDENVPDKIVQLAIERAQSVHLKPLIGYSLLKKLCDDGQANVLVEPYITLYKDFIIPFLFEAVEYEILPFISFKETPQGVVTSNNENAKPVEISVFNIRRANYEEVMDILGGELVRYLDYNQNNFPEYLTYTADKTNAQGNTMGQVYISPEVQAQVRAMMNTNYSNPYYKND